MVYVDFECGTSGTGKTVRKQLIAKKTTVGLEIYWQEVPETEEGI